LRVNTEFSLFSQVIMSAELMMPRDRCKKVRTRMIEKYIVNRLKRRMLYPFERK
jgi:hypothetical protein